VDVIVHTLEQRVTVSRTSANLYRHGRDTLCGVTTGVRREDTANVGACTRQTPREGSLQIPSATACGWLGESLNTNAQIPCLPKFDMWALHQPTLIASKLLEVSRHNLKYLGGCMRLPNKPGSFFSKLRYRSSEPQVPGMVPVTSPAIDSHARDSCVSGFLQLRGWKHRSKIWEE
jgi:hypothetical protein